MLDMELHETFQKVAIRPKNDYGNNKNVGGIFIRPPPGPSSLGAPMTCLERGGKNVKLSSLKGSNLRNLIKTKKFNKK